MAQWKLVRGATLIGVTLLWLVMMFGIFLVEYSVIEANRVQQRYGLTGWTTTAPGAGTDVDGWGLTAAICLAIATTAVCWAVVRRVNEMFPAPLRPFKRCPRCGYHLHGSSELGCAECGWNRRA